MKKEIVDTDSHLSIGPEDLVYGKSQILASFIETLDNYPTKTGETKTLTLPSKHEPESILNMSIDCTRRATGGYDYYLHIPRWEGKSPKFMMLDFCASGGEAIANEKVYLTANGNSLLVTTTHAMLRASGTARYVTQVNIPVRSGVDVKVTGGASNKIQHMYLILIGSNQ